jgi:2-polyprenyl-6-methoxyphenol hydroxylase-like FAD-dependent oxidoreductase
MVLSIAIVGAGPAGLCLAILQRNLPKEFKIHVYEGEASSSARSQDGSLDLHVGTGQRAIAAGLTEAFHAKIQHGADATSILNHNGFVLYEDEGGGGKARPE